MVRDFITAFPRVRLKELDLSSLESLREGDAL